MQFGVWYLSAVLNISGSVNNILVSMALAKIFHDTLKTYKLWPAKIANYRRYAITAIIINVITGIPLLIGIITHVSKLLADKTPHLYVVASSNIALSSLCVFYTIPVFIYFQEQISEVHNNIIEFRNYGKPKQIEKLDQAFNKLFFLYKWFLSIGLVAATGREYANKESCKANYREIGVDNICGLFINVAYPFSIDYFPVLEIIALYELIFMYRAYDAALAILCLPFVSIEFINVKIEHLKDLLQESFQNGNINDRKRKLRKCIAYHNHIWSLCQQVNATYGVICLPILLQFSINIGVPGFYFVLTHDIKALVLCITWIVGLFIGCLAGQRLINKSESVATIIYTLPWYECDTAMAKDLLIILARAQKPLQFYPGKYYMVSFITMKDVLTGTYSLIALLYTTLQY